MLKNKLEIILITYNRKDYLQNTFNQIFADNSPISDYPIRILNNQSDDGTTELIEEYCKKLPNIKHVIHNRNIGGNANIARAFEIATKEYFWVLCDDDEYDFTHWEEVEQAVMEGHDAIVISNYAYPQKSIAHLLKQMTFVPSTIYKTENITPTVMTNIEYCISSMFPQLALPCHLINENKSIHICKAGIVNMIPHGGVETYVRGLDHNAHPYMAHQFWSVGYVNACQLIKNPQLRKEILYGMSEVKDGGWLSNLRHLVVLNKIHYNSFKKNWSDIFFGFSAVQKIQFLLCILYFYLPLYVRKLDGNYDLVFLQKIKIRIWSKKWSKKNK